MASQIENSSSTMSEAEVALPIQLTIDYPERLSRWRLFLKWLFVIIPAIIVFFWGMAVAAVLVIAFFAVLIVGRFPRVLFDFVVEWYRYYLRVSAYFPYLLVDTWWPGDDNHPLQFEVEFPDKLSRGIVILKLITASLGILGYLVGSVSSVIFLFAIPAWFIILFTGKYPRGMYNMAVMLYQWVARVDSWQIMLRDELLLFGTTKTVKVLVIIGIIVALVVAPIVFALQILPLIMAITAGGYY